MFANTMKELMQTTPLHEIRVTEICKLCGSDRKTFYYHFKDKYDLVNWIFDIEFFKIIEERAQSDTWENIEALIKAVKDYGTFA